MHDALTFDDVSFRYPAFSLRGVSFGVRRGSCVALTGPNGGGKTTLGKLAAGLLKPEKGRVVVDGEDIAPMPLGRIGARVGYLFQDPSRQLFAPTVLEDLTFPAVMNGTDETAARAAGRDMLRKLGLEHLENRSVFRFSGGEKQRLALAGILMRKPCVLILDEPTTNIDSRNRENLGEILRERQKAGTAVLLITHDINFAGKYCGGKLRIDGGVLY
jgi:energy-coupling factor transport system ATP-binding protein